MKTNSGRKACICLSKVDLRCTRISPGLGRLRKEGLESEASLGYTVRPRLKATKPKLCGLLGDTTLHQICWDSGLTFSRDSINPITHPSYHP